MSICGPDQQNPIKKLGIDRVIENKVEWGIYQKKALAFLCLIDLNDGVELILMTIILPILKNQYLLNNQQIEWISFSLYFGMFAGAYMSGMISDRFGRKYTIFWSQIVQGCVAIYFTLITNYYGLLVIRYLYGMVYGFSLPLSTTMFSEISPLQQRGKGIVIINSAVGFGKLYGVFMAYLLMSDYETGNWKLMVVISSIPCFICAYGVLKYILESPRYLLVQGRYLHLSQVLNKMIEINKKDGADVIDDKDMQEFQYQKSILYDQDEYKASTKNLFQPGIRGVTLRVWIIWFMYHTMSKGQLLILPFIVGKTEKGLSEIVYTVLGEIPAMILAIFVVDEAKFFGRKKTLVYFFILGAIFNVFCFYDYQFTLSMFISRFCFREVSSMMYTYTTEVYPTHFRVLGIGWATGLGRIGTCLMSFYLLPLLNINPFYPFMVFAAFCLICTYCSFTLPVDTTGKQLDNMFRVSENSRKIVTQQNIELLQYPSSLSDIEQYQPVK